MSKKDEKGSYWDEWDGEYIGNIWGWKNSFIGLFLIVIMLALMIYRHATLDTPTTPPEKSQILQKDTIGTNIEGRE
ncbi:MAG: hypothetical protein AAGG75_09130 [Bacteroidota bacterium]